MLILLDELFERNCVCIFNECMEPSLCQHRTCNNLRFAFHSDHEVITSPLPLNTSKQAILIHRNRNVCNHVEKGGNKRLKIFKTQRHSKLNVR